MVLFIPLILTLLECGADSGFYFMSLLYRLHV